MAPRLGRLGGVAEQHLAGGGEVDLFQTAVPALGQQVEGGQRIDLIVPVFHTGGLVHVRRVDVHDIAAYTELARAVHLTAPDVPGGKEPRHQRFPVVDHAGLEGEGVPQELIPGHRVLQQCLGGHADGVQPPARQRAQHRQAAVLVLAARALHRPQHEVTGREHCRGQAQRLEVVRKVGGLGLAGGHDAQHPVKVLLQGGVQQGTASRRQAEQRRRARGVQALRDLLIFRCAFQQRFVHRRPPLEANTFGKLNPTVIASQCHRPY